MEALETLGSLWEPLGVFGALDRIWESLGAFNSFGDSMRFFGSLWETWELGRTREALKAFGIPLGPLGALGTPWDGKGAFVTHCDSLAILKYFQKRIPYCDIFGATEPVDPFWNS